LLGGIKPAISPKRLKIDRKLLLTAYIKSYTGFRLPPKCMTLNDLCVRFKVIDSLNAAKMAKYSLVMTPTPCRVAGCIISVISSLLTPTQVDALNSAYQNLQRLRAVCAATARLLFYVCATITVNRDSLTTAKCAVWCDIFTDVPRSSTSGRVSLPVHWRDCDTVNAQ